MENAYAELTIFYSNWPDEPKPDTSRVYVVDEVTHVETYNAGHESKGHILVRVRS